MGKVRILLVEDDKNNAMLIEAILTNHGYSVSGIVPTGEEAVDTALTTRPDLVLMDIKLRGKIDGIMAFEQIKESSDIPVLFVSAYADTTTIERAMKNKPRGYLTKPFGTKKLLRKVEMALTGWDKRDIDS